MTHHLQFFYTSRLEESEFDYGFLRVNPRKFIPLFYTLYNNHISTYYFPNSFEEFYSIPNKQRFLKIWIKA